MRKLHCAAPNHQEAQDPRRLRKGPKSRRRRALMSRRRARLLPSAEREKIWTTDDRAKGFAGGFRGSVIIQGYAREHALLDIVRERPERGSLKRERLQGGAKCRRHR